MDATDPFRIDRVAEMRAGAKDIAPAAIAAVPIGLLFGAVAVGKGLSPLEVALMSILVFAGGAQFAAIESWVLPGADPGARLLDLPDQCPPHPDGRFAVAEDAGEPAAEARRLLLPHRRGLGARRAPRPRAADHARLLARRRDDAALRLDRLDDPRRRCSARSSAIRRGSAPTSPSRPCSSASSPASAAPASPSDRRRERDRRGARPRLIGPPWHVACGALAGIAAAYLAGPPGERA